MDPDQLHALQGILLIVMPLFFIVIAAVLIIPYWFIWKKAGFSPWFSLLMFVPMVNLIMLYVLAFSQWKVVPAPQPAYVYYPPSPLPPRA
ncbi:MAG: hypothetical protein WBD10_09330 [Acidobacteriaceae bacterium]